jgi:hypothetical protein
MPSSTLPEKTNRDRIQQSFEFSLPVLYFNDVAILKMIVTVDPPYTLIVFILQLIYCPWGVRLIVQH